MSFAASLLIASLAAAPATHSSEAKPFTLQQVLSAPYATSLTAAPQGNLFAWVEDAEGRHNLWVTGPDQPARQLTHNTQDDAQEIAQLAWAPDASAIAYTYGAESGANGKPANPAHLQRPTPVQIIVQPLAPGAQPILIGEGHAPLFTPDGHSLLFVHEGQIWTADPTNPSAAHQLIFDRGSASQLTLSPDGHLLAFISHRSEANQPSHSFLALYDLEAHTLSFPDPSTSNDSAPAFSPDGNQLAWLRSPFVPTREFAPARTSPNPWSIQLADLATGTTRTLFSPPPNKPGSVLPHLADAAARLFFATNTAVQFYSEADGWVHLYQIHTEGNPSVEWLTPGSFEVEDATLSNDRHYLVYSSNQASADAHSTDQDRRHLWRIDLTRLGAPVELTHGDGIEARPQVAANGMIAALVSDTHLPMHPAFIADDGTITHVRPNFVPADYPATLVTPRQVLFTTLDGLHLHGQLFVPNTPAPANTTRPAILFFHGGPNRQMLLGYPGMDYYSNAYAMNQYLTAQGFIVLSVNYRCGIGYGLDFRECKNAGADGGTEYNDVLAAAKYLRSLPGVDPKRIGIWGGSYGGYLTALALARNSDLFAAGVDFHGVHDWNLEDNASDWKQGSFAEQDAITAKARSSSPIASLALWRSPVLFIHGDNDPDVAYAQTPILAEALRAKGIPVEELIFPDELHGFLLHKDWLAAYQAAAAFFVRTLKP
ncbi:prolyl oligopeptidase family serine peptidase [Granulicella sp. L46]|uniref:S9 family peptidase n=1 Tax=Granulicella sp. L46 TaxID=1641865 RepID=UPI00131E0D68|nr:prolyl oligopeptidase family serine peptidase [Granulicella sp. L46]